MSKGPGPIERAIAELLDREPDNAFTTEELCEKIYPTKHVERKHRIAAMRAAVNLAKRRDTMRIWQSEALRTYWDLQLARPSKRLTRSGNVVG